MAPESLRRRLSRRFSVIGSDDCHVLVIGVSVTAADREDLKFVEYLWTFGDSGVDTSSCVGLKRTERLDERADDWQAGWDVRGWIGTVDRPRRLASRKAT